MGGRGGSSRGGSKSSLWGDNGYGKEAKYVNNFISHGISISKPTGGTDKQNAFARSIKERVAKDMSSNIRGNGFDAKQMDFKKGGFVNVKNTRTREYFLESKKVYNEKVTRLRTSPKVKEAAKVYNISKTEAVNRTISSPNAKNFQAVQYKILKSKDSKEIINLYNRAYNRQDWW